MVRVENIKILKNIIESIENKDKKWSEIADDHIECYGLKNSRKRTVVSYDRRKLAERYISDEWGDKPLPRSLNLLMAHYQDHNFKELYREEEMEDYEEYKEAYENPDRHPVCKNLEKSIQASDVLNKLLTAVHEDELKNNISENTDKKAKIICEGLCATLMHTNKIMEQYQKFIQVKVGDRIDVDKDTSQFGYGEKTEDLKLYDDTRDNGKKYVMIHFRTGDRKVYIMDLNFH